MQISAIWHLEWSGLVDGSNHVPPTAARCIDTSSSLQTGSDISVLYRFEIALLEHPSAERMPSAVVRSVYVGDAETLRLVV